MSTYHIFLQEQRPFGKREQVAIKMAHFRHKSQYVALGKISTTFTIPTCKKYRYFNGIPRQKQKAYVLVYPKMHKNFFQKRGLFLLFFTAHNKKWRIKTIKGKP